LSWTIVYADGACRDNGITFLSQKSRIGVYFLVIIVIVRHFVNQRKLLFTTPTSKRQNTFTVKTQKKAQMNVQHKKKNRSSLV
jgi:hypothetical protein